MRILYGEAGKVAGAKFVKEIGDKTFSYTGKEEEGFLIEELIFNAVTSLRPEFKEKRFQAVVETKESVFIISFNDTESGDGENTVAYSFSEFTEDNISDFVSELINEEEVVFITYKDHTLSILFSDLEEPIEVSDKDIHVEKLISKLTRLKTILSNRAIEIILAILIVVIPIVTFKPIKSTFIDSMDIKIKELEKKKQEREKVRMNESILIKRLTNEFNKIRREKDILENPQYNDLWSS